MGICRHSAIEAHPGGEAFVGFARCACCGVEMRADIDHDEQVASLRAGVGRLEKARDGLCRLMHRVDVSEEARELAADYYRRSSKLTAQPAPLGNCSCGKPATVDFADIPMCAECRVKISEAMERRDKDVLRILDNAAQPAPEKPAERLTPHGRIIHEKNAIDVSGFPYPPETMDNEPGEPAGGK